MEELFRKQPPVKLTNSVSGSNGPNSNKDSSQVDGNTGGKKKDAVSRLFVLKWKNQYCD